MKKHRVPLPNKIVLYCIFAVRPLLGPAHCRYMLTCTQFAREQLSTKALCPAIWSITKRVISCNPFWK